MLLNTAASCSASKNQIRDFFKIIYTKILWQIINSGFIKVYIYSKILKTDIFLKYHVSNEKNEFVTYGIVTPRQSP